MWRVTACRSREGKQRLKGETLLFYHLTNIHDIPALTAKVLLSKFVKLVSDVYRGGEQSAMKTRLLHAGVFARIPSNLAGGHF